ncbi:MAG: biopolymer transporter ExbD [Methylococcales bacterium]
MNFRHKKREKLDITLISMIDVLFVLLLFFMVSTTFNRNTEVKLKLPEADSTQAEQHSKLINLTINAEGVYSLTSEDGSVQPLADQQLETLKQALSTLVTRSKELPFVINADARTPHQFVISALEAASAVGFSHITFAALHSKPKS